MRELRRGTWSRLVVGGICAFVALAIALASVPSLRETGWLGDVARRVAAENEGALRTVAAPDEGPDADGARASREDGEAREGSQGESRAAGEDSSHAASGSQKADDGGAQLTGAREQDARESASQPAGEASADAETDVQQPTATEPPDVTDAEPEPEAEPETDPQQTEILTEDEVQTVFVDEEPPDAAPSDPDALSFRDGVLVQQSEDGSEQLVGAMLDGSLVLLDEGQAAELIAAESEALDDAEVKQFEMPEDAAYVPEEALISIAKGADAGEVVAALEGLDGIAGIEYTSEELEAGVIRVTLEAGVDVEDAVNELLSADAPVIESAQPNYLYRLDHTYTRAYLHWACDPHFLTAAASRALKEEALAASDVADALVGLAEPSDQGETVVFEESDKAGGSVVVENDPLPTGEGTEASPASPAPSTAGGATATDAAGDVAGADATAVDTATTDTAGAPAATGTGAPDATAVNAPTDGEQLGEGVVVFTEGSGDAASATGAQGQGATNKADGRSSTGGTGAATTGDAADGLTKGEGALALTQDVQDWVINDLYRNDQWALTSMRVYKAWSLARAEGAVTVAVIDNGFEPGHEDLSANMLTGYNAVNGSTDVTPPSGDGSPSHGTHVAGIVGAVANNQKGVAGVSYNAHILPIRVFDMYTDQKTSEPYSGASTSSLTAAYSYIIAHASEYGIRVVNMSLGTGSATPFAWDDNEDVALAAKILEARSLGIVSVASAGNDQMTRPYYSYPSDHAAIVGVINLTKSSSGDANDASGTLHVDRDGSSNYNVPGQGGTDTGAGKNISAPGSSIISTTQSTSSSMGGYAYMGGTSMASPQVAGVLALIFAANPGLSAEQATAILYGTAHDLGASGWDEGFGWGEVDAYAAVERAKATAPAPPAKSLLNATVTLSPDSFTYDATAKEPSVTVSMDGALLTQGTHYRVSYSDNVNVGNGKVTITALANNPGNYTDSKTVSFPIRPIDISTATVTLDRTSFVYGDTASGAADFTTEGGAHIWTHLPQVTVSLGGTQLKQNEWIDQDGVSHRVYNDYSVETTNFTDAGTGTVTIRGNGNYGGTVTRDFTISPCDLSRATIALSQSSYTYSGAQCLPSVTVKVGNVVQSMAYDYSLSYEGGLVNAGSPSVTVLPKERNLTGGSVSKPYTINPASLSSLRLQTTSFAYDGSAKRPGIAQVMAGSISVPVSGYTASYPSAVGVGTYTVSVTGKGNFKGTAKASFSIGQAALTSCTLATTSYGYDGGAKKPGVAAVWAGKVRVPNGSFTVSYPSAVNAGSYSVTVSGTGNFKGTARASFNIAPASLASASVSLSPGSFTYDGGAKQPGVTVKLGSRTLAASDYGLTYANNVNAGNATVTITGKGNFTGSKQAGFHIAPASLASASVALSPASFTYDGAAKQPGVTVKLGSRTLGSSDYGLTYANNVNAGNASVTVTGKGNYTGSKQAGFHIAPASLASAALELDAVAFAYDGSPKQPGVTVRVGGRTLGASDYDLTFANNTEVGTGTVTASGKGNYAGAKSASFTISNQPSWTRLKGPNAYDTMSAVVGAEGVFASGRGGTVLVATGDGYWDALAAAGLAGRLDAPVLITPTGRLGDQTRAEIQRMAPSEVLIMGGTGSVSPDCEQQLREVCPNVARVSGQTAADTAVEIYRRGSGWGKTAIVATTAGYWDALSIGPYAFAKAAPIFLATRGGGLPASAIEALSSGGFERVVIVGGSSSVPEVVEEQARSAGVGTVLRLRGATALDTSAEIGRWELGEGMTLHHLSVASSQGYWDALTAASVCGKQNSVLVLVPATGGYTAFDAVYDGAKVIHGHVLGGNSSVSDESFDYFASR